MKYFEIKVDEEIYKYLKGKAEPFVDTPNAVLRRELLKKTNGTQGSGSIREFPELPNEIPAALRHTLEVIYLVKQKGISRPEATKIVANRHKIATQTVLDKYCRQLNKKAFEIDKLLDEKDLNGFRTIIRNNLSDHKSVIEKLVKKLTDNSGGASKKSRKNKENLGNNHISLRKLEKRGDELLNSEPTSLLINECKYKINTWTEFDKAVVNWLVQNGHLDSSDLPVYAPNSKDRYFLNTECTNPSKEEWTEIQDGIYLNSKFNTPRHIKNVLELINHLSVEKKCNIKVAIR